MKCSRGTDYKGICLCKDYAGLMNQLLATPQKGKKKKSIDDFITFCEKKAIKKIGCKSLDTNQHIETLNLSVGQDIKYYICKKYSKSN
jgi:hypothetical protein|tara:strand:- start:958 stop:1221 length:264 start_codon:yes stop_codon:yes gene_type:complete